ncbi:GNAT family N-acetyltransferase [Micromonospora sp. NBC_01405]|uniref:GNAT family N-acetyltransferase n=1 Tax=Micromonospora sp. NBC_01405 TaxID=2903589 RepID=UPI003246FBC2
MRQPVDREPVILQVATAQLWPVVERLGQLYRHDLSEFRGMVPRADGLFAFDQLPSFLGAADRVAHLIRWGRTVAGFALTRHPSDGPSSVAAFFVVRALRRRSVGHRAASELLHGRPGGWEITFQEENPGAARFWRAVAASVGTGWREERRPVPGKPQLPPDTWLLLDVPTPA